MSSVRRARLAAVCGTVLLAVVGCTATGSQAPESVSTTFGHEVLAAETDLGSTADKRAVRQASLAALSEAIQAFVVDSKFRHRNPADALTAVVAPASSNDRAVLLGRDRSPRLAKGLDDSFVFYARKEFGPDWTGSGSRTVWLNQDVWASAAFHVDRWEGVRVGYNIARVLVRGEDRGTSWGGTDKRDNWAQYQLIFHRDPTAPHGWRLTHQQAASTAA
jgi:hypothetical protein